jgi:putative DNA primase/helicase
MFDTLLPTLAAAGINTERLPYHLAVGKFYRLPAIGKSAADKSCYVKILATGVAVFGNWPTGDKGTWFANKPTDKAELARWEKEAKAAQAKANREQVKAWNEAAIMARAMWFDMAGNPDLMHPYLVKKRLKPYGLKQINDILLVPVYSLVDNKIQTLQRIYPTKLYSGTDKMFLDGGNSKGYFAARRYKQGEQIVIAEGWATSQSLAQQWHIDGWHVCAFSSGNLITVAKAMRKRHPFAQIIIAADNDESWRGQVSATQAAKAIGASVTMPTFTAEERDQYGKVSDWQDRWHIDQRNIKEVARYAD